MYHSARRLGSEARLSAAERPRALADLQREANLLLNLRHPNLPPAIDLFEEAGKHFLVMAFVQGETLEERLERAGEPLAVADVLGYRQAQRPPVIYRDLKPATAHGRSAGGGGVGTLWLFGEKQGGDNANGQVGSVKGDGGHGHTEAF